VLPLLWHIDAMIAELMTPAKNHVDFGFVGKTTH
jgi:hypothetical protein